MMNDNYSLLLHVNCKMTSTDYSLLIINTDAFLQPDQIQPFKIDYPIIQAGMVGKWLETRAKLAMVAGLA